MIEFLPPRADAFGEDPADFVGVDDEPAGGFDDEPPRPRWVTGLAALSVTGLLAAGVIAAAPWDGDDVGDATDTTTVPTTAPTTPSTARASTLVTGAANDPLLPDSLERPTGWLPADESSGFVVSSATSVEARTPRGDAFAVWAAEGATRTSGTWLVVDEVPPRDGELRRGGTVIDVDRTDGTWPSVLTVADDGVVELALTSTDPLQPWFTLTGSGWSVDELRTLAAGIVVEAGTIAYDSTLVAADGLLGGLVEVFRGTTEWYPGAPVAGNGRAFTWLVDPASGRDATVAVTALGTPGLFVARFLERAPIDEITLRRAERAQLAELASNGRRVELFRPVLDRGAVGATWFDGGGNEVSVVIDGTVGALLELVAVLEPATDDAWATAVATERTPDNVEDRPVEIAGSAGEGWSIQVSADSLWINATDGWLGTRWPVTDGRSAIRFANTRAAYLVLVDATRGTADGRLPTSAIVRQGDATQQVPLVGLVDGSYVAAVRIDPRAPFTVEWLAADGTVLSTTVTP